MNDILKEALKDVSVTKTDLPISSYGSVDLDELNKTVERLNKIPNMNDLVKENNQLQSNWNSLRKCIISVIEGAREELNTIIHTTDIDTKDGLEYVNQCSREFDVIRKNLEIVLDKMNELEEKDKNERQL